MDRSLGRHEQYSRRNCILIHDVKKKNEKVHTDKIVIEIFEKVMQEKVSANDTDRSHRKYTSACYHQTC